MAEQPSVEVLKTGGESTFGGAVLKAAIEALEASGARVRVTEAYTGRDDWLCLYGGGERTRVIARKRQLRKGGSVLMWDLGYFGRSLDPATAYGRMTVDDFHPWRYLDVTPSDPSRWAVHGIELREDADPLGPVIVIGMGRKSRKQLNLWDWEERTIREMRARYPMRRVIYRPKSRLEVRRGIENATQDRPIQEVIRGASVVVCRHSNVAIDACIAGIPVECEDGAAYWLYGVHRSPTVEQRLDLLHRVAYWQYRLDEMDQAWAFAQAIAKGRKT